MNLPVILSICYSLFLNIEIFCENINSLENCQEIFKSYDFGRNSFSLEQEHGEYLATHEYSYSEPDGFSLTFLNLPLSENMTEDFYRTNSALRGFQNVYNSFDNVDISQCLRQKISKCQIGRFEKDENCNNNQLYRNLNGTCNNLKNPYLGASLTQYSRILYASYSDGIWNIRKDSERNDLTSPRIIVDKILSTDEFERKNNDFNLDVNVGWYFFGQLLTHDCAGMYKVERGTEQDNRTIRCCSHDYKTFLTKSELHHSCLPFEIGEDDKYFSSTKTRCHHYIRSQNLFSDVCQFSPAQQINSPTQYLDLSMIYGIDDSCSEKLRTMQGGLLKIDSNNILPIKQDKCKGDQCYFTGDERATQTPSLAILHSLFIRLHNKIAEKLETLNNHWNDEKIFQESRRICIALFQHIVFEEYLPTLIGEDYIFTGEYDETISSMTLNDFMLAFRQLHAYTPPEIKFYNEEYQENGSINISKLIFQEEDLLKYHYNEFVRGLMLQKITDKNHYEILNKMMGGPCLISIDIQRGRDHGIQTYTNYRKLCQLPDVNNFDDLYPLISMKNIELLSQLYPSVQDIDLYVGGALERTDNLYMGPTFRCLTKIQFSLYKSGDRYFYTHKNGQNPFTDSQLAEIKTFKFSKLLCITNLNRVPMSGFMAPNRWNKMVVCDSISQLNLISWKE